MIQPNNMTLENHLDLTVSAFRCGQEGTAHETLTLLIDSLGKLLTQLEMEAMLQLAPLLEEILTAVARKDFSWAADLMEYKLSPLIKQ